MRNRIQHIPLLQQKTKQMQIILTPEEKQKILYNALVNGVQQLNNYGVIKSMDGDYKEAKQKMTQLGKGSFDGRSQEISYEDVWMQILIDGKKLKYTDDEDSSLNREFGIEEVYAGIDKLSPERILSELDIKEEALSDANTGCEVLETILFGKVIFC